MASVSAGHIILTPTQPVNRERRTERGWRSVGEREKESVSQSHCARMIQDDTNSSDSITSQSSTALVTLLVEVWDIYLEYLTTHTSMHLTNEFRKV